MWRFEVVYSFINEESRSALNFRVNRPPSNGSCAISPTNGTTMTLFSVSCPYWIDEDQIKDYSLYRKIKSRIEMNINIKTFVLVRSNNQSEWIFVTYSSVETFEVLFPPGDHQLMISIRDRRDCVTHVNLTNISVLTSLFNLKDLSNLSWPNPVHLLLLFGNPTTKTQMVNIISQQMNQNNVDFLRNASSSNYRSEIIR